MGSSATSGLSESGSAEATRPDRSIRGSARKQRRSPGAAGGRGKRVLVFILLLAVGLAIWTGTVGPEPLLILGIDRRPGDVGRTDVILLASPQWSRGRLVLFSVPRDTRVELPGVGPAKINRAYPVGGADLVRDRLEALGIPAGPYMLFDLEGVRAVVDALGGVELEVDRRMSYRDPAQDLVIDLQPGTQRLDGDKALQYIRFRGDPTGDIARVERQRRFVTALLRQAAHPSNWARWPGAYRALREHLETDLPPWELWRWALASSVAAVAGVEADTLPGKPGNIGGGSYWLVDEEAAHARTRELFGRHESFQTVP